MARKTVYTLKRIKHIVPEISVQQKIRKHIATMEVQKHKHEFALELSTCIDLMHLFLSAEDYGKTIVDYE